MQTNLHTANPAGQLIALPAPESISARKTTIRPRHFQSPTEALLRARVEALRSAAMEDFVWLALGLSAVALVIVCLWG